MIQPAYLALCLIVVSAPAYAADIAGPADGQWAKYVVDHLDVTSFPSSIGPRRQEGKTTLADYGMTPVDLSANDADLQSASKDWSMGVTIVRHNAQAIVICFSDFAENGGSYEAAYALTLTLGPDGAHLQGKQTPEADPACGLTRALPLH